MSDVQTVMLRKVGQDDPIRITGRRTSNGNLSFDYAGQRHIMRPDGAILQMVRFASTAPRWERSPVLSLVSAT